jgi:hypothetical protein
MAATLGSIRRSCLANFGIGPLALTMADPEIQAAIGSSEVGRKL